MPNPQLNRDIARDRETCESATAGPWIQRRDLGKPWTQDIYAGTPNCSITCPQGFKREDDAAFASEARTALPEYIAFAAEVKRIVEMGRAAIDIDRQQAEAFRKISALFPPTPANDAKEKS